GDVVVERLLGRLDADLDVIQPRVLEGADALLGEAHSRGDEVGVIAHSPRLRDQYLQVAPRQRLAAGKAELDRPHGAGLLENADPFLGGEFVLVTRVIDGVGAIRTLQRT